MNIFHANSFLFFSGFLLKLIVNAYSTLSDESKRKIYDESLRVNVDVKGTERQRERDEEVLKAWVNSLFGRLLQFHLSSSSSLFTPFFIGAPSTDDIFFSIFCSAFLRTSERRERERKRKRTTPYPTLSEDELQELRKEVSI
jgi:DnaJ-class molecular chaperone